MPGIDIGWYSCGSISRTEYDTFLSTFIGETDGRSWTTLYDDATSGSATKVKVSSAGSSNAFGSISGGATATTTVNNGASSTISSGAVSTGTTNTKPKKTSIGPIIGGIAGGLAVIGAIIAGLILLFMKKKKTGTPAVAPDTTNVNNAPPMGPDMRQSVYGQPPPPQGYPQGPYPAPQQQYPQQQFDHQNGAALNPGHFAAGKFDQNSYGKQDGPQVTEQSVPPSPLPPTSPAPPYVQPVQQQHESWNQTPISLPTQSPPPQMMQQGPYQPPQPQGPALVELGTNTSLPQRNAEGRPVCEAA